jgi:hypothetical protein
MKRWGRLEEAKMRTEMIRRVRKPRFIIKPRIVQNGVTVLKGHADVEERVRESQCFCEGGVCFLRWKPNRKSA